MTAPLWTWTDLEIAAAGTTDGAPPAGISGFSIDTRSISSGEVFVALTDQRDGHDFVPAAFKAGAAAALVRQDYVRQPGDGTLLRVDDPLRAVVRIGIAARARLAPTARVIAVTGSAGKTGTKEMLRVCLATAGSVHASTKSFNNHWGVPLSLAGMPAATRFGVFEIGMNHAGEITPLTRMVRPHVAIITNVLPVHIGHFADGEVGIADAKAEILLGLEPGGVAVLPFDSSHFPRLMSVAEQLGVRMLSFGARAGADIRARAIRSTDGGSDVEVAFACRSQRYHVGIAGEHIASNSLAVVAVLDALAMPLTTALVPMATLSAPPGRGARSERSVPGGRILLIDESYNANPASMRAALAVIGGCAPRGDGRRIAVIGDMRELGDAGPELHRGLGPSLEAARIDRVFACGLLMRHLFDTLSPAVRGSWAETSTGLCATLLEELRDGDVVMVKGSLGTNMAPIIAALTSQATRVTSGR